MFFKYIKDENSPETCIVFGIEFRGEPVEVLDKKNQQKLLNNSSFELCKIIDLEVEKPLEVEEIPDVTDVVEDKKYKYKKGK